MFDIGWTELVLIGVVALIVIGPKDLPQMFHQLGRFTAKIRAMGREFQRAMDEAARESGVKDVAKDLKSATSAKSLGLDAVKDAASRFEKWDPLKEARKPAAGAKTQAAAEPTAAAADAAVASDAPAGAAVAPDAPPPAKRGPATQALAEKRAARKAILDDAAARLKAADAAPAPAAKPKAARKKKAEPS